MIYSRCLYYIELLASAQARTACRVSRATVKDCFAVVCDMARCGLEAISVGPGYVRMLVELQPDISVHEFLRHLRLHTGKMIVEKSAMPSDGKEVTKVSDASDATAFTALADEERIDGGVIWDFSGKGYWDNRYHMAAVSPDDKAPLVAALTSNGDYANVLPLLLRSGETIEYLQFDGVGKSTESVHLVQIIIIAANGSLRLPLRYSVELQASANRISCELGARSARSATLRNHVHLLCEMPTSVAVGKFVDELKERLDSWLRTNPHFGQFDGWLDDSIVHTISSKRREEELYNLIRQPEIHRPFMTPNEMSYLYRRLQIPYLISLR